MSEVHFSFAKNSELIFTVDGRHLCSSFNPTKEAQQWVSHHQAQWRDCDALIVLGVGCGYHLRALKAASHAEVVGVEVDANILAAALRVHPLDLRESETTLITKESDFLTSEPLIRATRKSYAVLLHEPSALANPALYAATRRFLLGRNRDGLVWLFRNRNIPVNSEFRSDEAVSLKHLESILANEKESVNPLLNALRELIT